MFAFPGMLVEAAIKAGMKVPNDPDSFDANEYPHFLVFCTVQLGTSMPYPGVHFDNAKVVASIPNDQITKVTLSDLISAGLCITT
jgi:hypothetical protein